MNAPIWFSNLLFWSAQVAILSIVAWAMTRLLCLRDPRVLLVFWRGLLVICFLLPLVEPWHLLTVATPLLESAPIAIAPTTFAPASPQSRWHIPTLEQSAPIIAAAIFAVVAIRFALFALGLLKLRQLRRASSPVSAAGDSCAATLNAARSLVDASADFHLTRDVDSPVTFGLISPAILLPERFPNLDPHMQTGIACHELLHVRRRDWAHHLAEEVFRALLWFHPAVLWMIGRIRLSREQVVDREVVRLTDARKPYLEALLEFTARPRSRFAAIPAPPFLEERQLAERVALMLREVRMSRTRLIASLSAIACTLCAAVVAAVWTFPLKASVRAPQTIAPLASVHYRASDGATGQIPASADERNGNQYVIETSVIVKSPTGGFISGLTKTDFVVTEDGATKNVEFVRTDNSSSEPHYLIGFGSEAGASFHRVDLRLSSRWGTKDKDYMLLAGPAQYSKLAGGVSSGISQGISGGIAQGISHGISGGISSGISQGAGNGVAGGVSGGVSGRMRLIPSQSGDDPSVSGNAIWIDTVKRGTLPLRVLGLGTIMAPNGAKNSTARIVVPENNSQGIEVGKAGAIDTHAGIVDGRITSIKPNAAAGMLDVYVALESDLPPGVGIGSSVQGSFNVGQLDDVLYVGRPVFAAVNSEGSIFKISDGGARAQRVNVRYGRASANSIAVLAGLNEGDSVILSDMSAYDSFNRIQIKH